MYIFSYTSVNGFRPNKSSFHFFHALVAVTEKNLYICSRES